MPTRAKPAWALGIYAGGIVCFFLGLLAVGGGLTWVGVVLVAVAILLMAVATAGFSAFFGRKTDHLCEHCEYDLTGLANPSHCPECGHTLR